MLTDKERRELQKTGALRVKIIRTAPSSYGAPDYLLEGQGHSGEMLRGWWYDGIPACHIRWEFENVDGWPKYVAAE